MPTNKDYQEIQLLSEYEHLRKRPSLYIGNVNTPLPLLNELVDNALDEVENGDAKEICVWVDNKSIKVSDSGRGFPYKDSHGNDAIVTAFRRLFSGGKFDGKAYSKGSIGLHGIGLVACNAYSTTVIVKTIRDKKVRYREFHNFKLVKSEEYSAKPNQKGTEVYIEPDPKIFDHLSINLKKVEKRLRLARTFVSAEIYLNDIKLIPYSTEELLGGKCDTKPIIVEAEADNQRIQVILAYSYTSMSSGDFVGSVNLMPVDRGSHITFGRRIIGKAWEAILSRNDHVDLDDVLLGSRCSISCRLLDPAFTSQTKEQLKVKPSTFGNLPNILIRKLAKELKKRKDEEVGKLIHRFVDYRKQMNRMGSEEYLEEVLEHGDVNGGKVSRNLLGKPKLIDCTSENRKGTELFIVEGGSAAGGLVQQRNRETQAVLPLRGKPLNIVGKNIQKVMANEEIKSMINSIGVGAFSNLDLDKLRYDRIIICTDADVDGYSIAALIVGAFCDAIPDLIRNRCIYHCTAPLFGYHDNGQFVPVYDESKLDKTKKFSRYKGLGAMNPDELAVVALNPSTRRLKRIGVKDIKHEIKQAKLLVGSSEKKRELMDSKDLIVI